MANYAIGDVQGCYDPLQRLLERIDFDETTDRLWFVGDLVNRGHDSLAVLRFVKQLPLAPRITLGNHDLYLLMKLFLKQPSDPRKDTLQPLLDAPDADELAHWLRFQPLLYHDKTLQVVMTHAGIPPIWSLAQAAQLARELEAVLQGEACGAFFETMRGNKPACWSNNVTGMDRFRIICNYLTRMRYLNRQGQLDFRYDGSPAQAPKSLLPWYDTAFGVDRDVDMVFGHWSALQGHCPHPRIHAIDTGCVWGGPLTALRLEDKQRFMVSGL